MAWMKVRIPIPENLGPQARETLGILIRNQIQDNANNGQGVSKIGVSRKKNFPGYTEGYADKKKKQRPSWDGSTVDLTLSAKMLADFNLISHKKGSVLIGFQNGTESNAKAEGNVTGSYGRSPNKSKARNFLGLPSSQLKELIKEVKEDG